MKRKQINSSRYIAAFAITIVIFLLGIMVSNVVNENKLSKVNDLENNIRVESLGNELVFDILSNDLCENINLTGYTKELSELGKKLTYMEGIYGYKNSHVANLKNYYSLLLIRHWLINEKAKETCEGIDTPSVLYFYSNFLDCGDCEDQGLVLTNVHKDYPFFNIYSFEYQESNPALDFLKEKYKIDPHRLPVVVIDGKVFYGFQSKDFLIDYMDLKTRLSDYELKNNNNNNNSSV